MFWSGRNHSRYAESSRDGDDGGSECIMIRVKFVFTFALFVSFVVKTEGISRHEDIMVLRMYHIGLQGVGDE
jgi:hypothetical protein